MAQQYASTAFILYGYMIYDSVIEALCMHLQSGVILGDDLELSGRSLSVQLLHHEAKAFHRAGNVVHDCRGMQEPWQMP